MNSVGRIQTRIKLKAFKPVYLNKMWWAVQRLLSLDLLLVRLLRSRDLDVRSRDFDFRSRDRDRRWRDPDLAFFSFDLDLSFDRRVDFFFLDFDLSRDFFLSRDRCLLRLDLLPDRERFRFGDPSGSAGATVGLDSSLTAFAIRVCASSSLFISRSFSRSASVCFVGGFPSQCRLWMTLICMLQKSAPSYCRATFTEARSKNSIKANLGDTGLD